MAAPARINVDEFGTRITDGVSIRGISADGSRVLFSAGGGETPFRYYLRDRESGDVRSLLNRTNQNQAENGSSFFSSTSSDLMRFAFTSDATNLVVSEPTPPLTGDEEFLFLYDDSSQEVIPVSQSEDGSSGRCGGSECSAGTPWVYDFTLSGDGEVVFFSSERDFIGTGSSGGDRLYYYLFRVTDRSLESVNDLAPLFEAGASTFGYLSEDGSFFAGSSLQSSDGVFGCYLYHFDRQELTIINREPDGRPTDVECDVRGITPDGRFVLLDALSPGVSERNALLVPASPENALYHSFVYDRLSGELQQISLPSIDGPNTPDTLDFSPADFDSFALDLSDDGRFVLFSSQATTLVPEVTNGAYDLFVADRTNGQVRRVSRSFTGEELSADSELGFLSGNGSSLVFETRDFVSVSDGEENYNIYLDDGYRDLFQQQLPGGFVLNPDGTLDSVINASYSPFSPIVEKRRRKRRRKNLLVSITETLPPGARVQYIVRRKGKVLRSRTTTRSRRGFRVPRRGTLRVFVRIILADGTETQPSPRTVVRFKRRR
ncbi:hypothetical protein MRY87_13650 [bacterium]|nr:hypothetical protein [bacterium]